MTTRMSAMRSASARLEALEGRSLFSGGEIDHAFGTGGLAGLNQFGVTDSTHTPAEAVQADGKIVVVGASKSKSTTAVVTRYLTTGQVDTSFGTNGTATVANVNAARINAVSVLAGGQILVQGATYFRLTKAGQLDTSFGGGDGIAPSIIASDRRGAQPVNTTAVLSDGSFVELQSASNGASRLFKYKADGSVDTSFGSGGSFNVGTLNTGGSDDGFEVGGVAADASGRLYVSYHFVSGSDQGYDTFRVVRLTSAGKVDTSYGTNGIASDNNEYAYLDGPIAVLSDGRVSIVREDRTTHAPANPYGIVVFSADGKSFSTADLSQPAYVHASQGAFVPEQFIAAKDGSLYVGGTSYESENIELSSGQPFAAVLHLNKDLSIDHSYSEDEDGIAGYRIGSGTQFGRAVLTPSNKVVVLGGTTTQAQLVQFSGSSTSPNVRGVYPIDDGRLIVQGSSGDDHIVARNVSDPDEDAAVGTLIIDLDNNGVLVSRDQVIFDPDHPVGRLVVDLNSGNDTFDGHGLTQSVYVNAGAGDDQVTGGTGNDTLYGGPGLDTLAGGGGTDKIVQDS